MGRIFSFGYLLQAHPKPIPLVFIPALCHQAVGGLCVWQRQDGCSRSQFLLTGFPNGLYFPVSLAEECGT